VRARLSASFFAAALLFCTVSASFAQTGPLTPQGDQPVFSDLSGGSYCAGVNPSCGRDPWWLQWNELQSTDLVSLNLTERPLTAESRYHEALQLLWGWDEGKELLTHGSEYGVAVVSGLFPREPTAIASYSTARRAVQINPRYAQAATWMLAAVISHEMRHISDAHQRLYQAHAQDDCLMRETRAYETESRFIAWYTQSVVGEQIPVRELRKRVRSEHRSLSDLLVRISSEPDAAAMVREDYGELCTKNP
jgi:hypothetical protein